jgi:hypothetical protein
MKVSDGDRLFYISTDFEWMRVENWYECYVS